MGEAMTLTLEIAPETLRALEEKAQRAGVPLTAYAVGVLEHDVTGNGATGNGTAKASATNGARSGAGHLSAFLSQADDLSRRLEGEPDFEGVDGAELVRAGREERMQRLGEAWSG